ncbi:MAG: glycosyltransferase [Flavobacteriales bacterium]|jgi:glycosyltransferase involved in cell wall biosynthesis|nr:glycosyltransferase [Flavobacteriales bacterium]
MRILQLCHKPPYPPIDGGSKAMHNLTRGLLASGHAVKVLCIRTPKHPLDPADLPAAYVKATRIESSYVDTSLNAVDAFTDLITADNYNISRFFSPDMDILLIRTLSSEAFDVVLLESLFMTPYIATIRRYSKAPIVLRSHNLEHVIQERIASGERNIIKRPYRRFLARQLKEYEMAVMDRVDGVAAISPADAEHFAAHGKRTRITTIPFGVAPEEYAVAPPTDRAPVFFHLGSMDWLPNIEGIRWLLEQVWPKVIKRHPKARLHLAGNQMPKDLLALDVDGLQVKGRVKNANDYMAQRQVMLVPLFSAGGMRVKIVEGMALGKCVISTPMGAEGIQVTDGKDILLARNTAEFVDRMERVLTEPDLALRIGTHARKLIENRYSDKRIVNDLVAFFRTVSKA